MTILPIYDYVFIGSGISSQICSNYLNKKFNILILESGLDHFSSFHSDLNLFTGTLPFFRESHINRVRQFGGTCNVWPGRMMFLNEIDFYNKFRNPEDNWPFPFNDFLIYYERALNYFGLNYHVLSKEIFSESKNSYLPRDLDYKYSFWSQKVSRFNSNSPLTKKLIKQNNISILKDHTVTKLIFSEDNVDRVICMRNDHSSISVRGHNFILCTGGIENARLLLNSLIDNNSLSSVRNNIGRYFMEHPKLMSEPIPFDRNIFDKSVFGLVKKFGYIEKGYGFSKSYFSKINSPNHYIQIVPKFNQSYINTYKNFISILKLFLNQSKSKSKISFKNLNLFTLPDVIYQLAPKERLPHSVHYHFQSIRKYLYKKPIFSEFNLEFHLEQLPSFSNSITLCSRRDKFGYRLPKINCNVSDYEMNAIKTLCSKFLTHKNCTPSFVKKLSNSIDFSSFHDASHHMGATRMSIHPHNGVVDANLKVHGSRNLFICGSSVFPTSGHANPTLTIAALSLKLSDYLNTF